MIGPEKVAVCRASRGVRVDERHAARRIGGQETREVLGVDAHELEGCWIVNVGVGVVVNSSPGCLVCPQTHAVLLRAVEGTRTGWWTRATGARRMRVDEDVVDGDVAELAAAIRCLEDELEVVEAGDAHRRRTPAFALIARYTPHARRQLLADRMARAHAQCAHRAAPCVVPECHAYVAGRLHHRRDKTRRVSCLFFVCLFVCLFYF